MPGNGKSESGHDQPLQEGRKPVPNGGSTGMKGV